MMHSRGGVPNEIGLPSGRVDRLRWQDWKHLTIEEYTDQHFQPYIDRYNAKQRRKDKAQQIKQQLLRRHHQQMVPFLMAKMRNVPFSLNDPPKTVHRSTVTIVLFYAADSCLCFK